MLFYFMDNLWITVRGATDKERTMIRRAYIFTGRVQRVGFRDRALHGAASLGLTGWVRNEADGSVSMEVQGLEVSINKLLVYINQSRYIEIDRIRSKELPVVSEEKYFRAY